MEMEEPNKKAVDVKGMQVTHNQLLGLWTSHQRRSNSQQSHCIVVQPQWQDTIDPRKLVLGKVIGRGSYGVVHKGSYHGQTVAAKVLDFKNAKIPAANMEFVKEDFMHEVEVWKNLHHPNVTKMLGATISLTKNCQHKMIKKPRTENNFCVISEYLRGGSLRSYLRKNRNKKLPFKTVIRFAIDIARGLSYLHSKRVIHRDVKPENMLIDKQHTIKLADFGESVFEPLELFYTSERGTRGYMAPEVVSRQPYGHKCDVYSFGICLWEIYSCDAAYTFDLENLSIDIYKVMRPSMPLDCPEPLRQLMEGCWDIDPIKRPEMKEVVIKLEEFEKMEECQRMEYLHGVHGCFPMFRLGRSISEIDRRSTVRNRLNVGKSN